MFDIDVNWPPKCSRTPQFDSAFYQEALRRMRPDRYITAEVLKPFERSADGVESNLADVWVEPRK